MSVQLSLKTRCLIHFETSTSFRFRLKNSTSREKGKESQLFLCCLTSLFWMIFNRCWELKCLFFARFQLPDNTSVTLYANFLGFLQADYYLLNIIIMNIRTMYVHLRFMVGEILLSEFVGSLKISGWMSGTDNFVSSLSRA